MARPRPFSAAERPRWRRMRGAWSGTESGIARARATQSARARGIPSLQPPALLGETAPFLLQRRPVLPGRMRHAERFGMGQPVSGRGGAPAPFQILGQSRPKAAHRLEDNPVGQEICGDREPLPLDIAAIVEGEDGLEGLRAGPGRRRFVEDGHRATDEIGVVGHAASGRKPVRRGNAIAIEEDSRTGASVSATPLLRAAAAPFSVSTTSRRPPGRSGAWPRGVVDDDHLVLGTDLGRERRETAREPLVVLVMGDDDGDRLDRHGPAICPSGGRRHRRLHPSAAERR